mgnify:CR=1 FL=1
MCSLKDWESNPRPAGSPRENAVVETDEIAMAKAKSKAQQRKAADGEGAMGNVMDHARQVFKKYDKDKDGELNMAELKVVVEKTKS